MAVKRKSNNSCVQEWTLLARGVLALFWKRTDLQPLIDSDFELELSKNINLAREPGQMQEQHRVEYEPVLSERVSLLRRGLAVSFVFLASAVLLAVLMIAFGCRASGMVKIWLGGLSLFCFAWSTLARLGKPGTSWGGETVIERLDSRIFWFLYWLGTFAGTFALI
jgi:hypothetical protein